MTSAAVSWLKFLHRHTEEPVQLRSFGNSKNGGTPSRTIFTRDPDDVDAFVSRYNVDGRGTFFGVATRKNGGGIEHCKEIPAVWMECDKGLRPVNELLECANPPSAIIESGGGIHAYWVLSEPYDVSGVVAGEHRSHPVILLLGQLKRVFAGDPQVVDIARVMRLPGSHNSKYDNPISVEVIHQSDAEYHFDDLVEWCSWQRELVGEAPDPFLAASESLGIKPALDVEDALANMRYPENVHDVQLRVSASLASAGVPHEDIVDRLIEATRLAVGKEGLRWDWKREAVSIREMIATAEKKFSTKVVSLDTERKARKQANGPDAFEDTDKLPLIVKMGMIAMEVWPGTLATVGHEMWDYRDGVWTRFNPDLEAELRRHLQAACQTLGKNPNNNNKTNALKWILDNPKIYRAGVEWDKKPVIVGRNGAISTETREISPHSEEAYATRLVDCDLDPNAACPKWLEFLGSALPADAVECLQEWFGSALVRGKTREMTKGLIIFGPSRSGKTQVAQVLRALLGGNTCGIRARDIDGPFGLQPFLDKSGWVADDAIGNREALDPDNYKVIVTGEPVSVARKGATAVETAFDFPVCLTANNLPRIKDDSDAVYNRSIILPMHRVREEGEAEARPIFETVIETELAGVLNWALDGWERLRKRRRFDIPISIRQANESFKADNSPVAAWMKECIEVEDYVMVDRRDLLASFYGYMNEEYGTDSKKLGLRTFLPAIRQILPQIEERRNKAARYMAGVKLNEEGIDYIERYASAAFGESVGSGDSGDKINRVDTSRVRSESAERKERLEKEKSHTIF